MYRALIVDDEIEIRNGLVQILPWAEWGIDRVFSADDGDTALEVIEREKPDLIVTDIKMARVSGIELVKKLYGDMDYGGKVVVISGYDDFQYVKEALKLGVNDYLLKPINKNEFAQVIGQVMQQLDDDNKRRQNEIRMADHVEKAMPHLIEKLLRELTEYTVRSSSESRILYQLQNLNLEWLAEDRLAIIVTEVDNFKIHIHNKKPAEKATLLFAIGNVLKEALTNQDEYRHLVFQNSQEQWVIVIGMHCRNPGNVPDKLKELPETLRRYVEQYVKVRISAGLSPFGGWDNLKGLYSQAVQALQRKKIHTENGNEDEDPEKMDIFSDNEFALSDPAAVVEMLKYGTETEVMEMMAQFPGLTRKWGIHQPRELQRHSFEWLLGVYQKAQAAGWKEDGWAKDPIALWEQLEQFDTLDSLQKQLIEMLIAVSQALQVQRAPQSQIIQKAERYIVQHFMDNITLVMAADHVHVTPVWLSKLFKKEKGMTFSDYVTELRLEKARTLLHDVELKIYQICQMVGYQDPVNFTRLFKKKFGSTPKGYRNTRGIQVE